MLSIDSSKPNLEVSGSSSLTTYLYTSYPTLTTGDSDTYTESNIYVYTNEVEAYYMYMNEGSTLDVSWDSNSYGYIDYYILKGEDEYDDFMADNYFDYEYNDWGSSGGGSVYTVDEADTYYMVWWNYGSSYAYLDISIDYTKKEYSVASADISYTGDYSGSVSAYNYVVFVNESPSADVTVDYEFSRTGLGDFDLQSWVPIIIVAIGVIAIIRVVSKSKKVTPKTTTGATQAAAATTTAQTSKTPSYSPISAPNTTTPLYGQPSRSSSASSTPSGGFTMSSQTPAPKSYVSNRKLTQYQKDTLENLFKYSNRVYIYDAASQLRVSRDDLLALYRKDPDGFKGYKIDGEYLEAVATSSPTQSSSPGMRFCETCGNPLDKSSMERLNQRGSIFCGYCGKKIQR